MPRQRKLVWPRKASGNVPILVCLRMYAFQDINCSECLAYLLQIPLIKSSTPFCYCCSQKAQHIFSLPVLFLEETSGHAVLFTNWRCGTGIIKESYTKTWPQKASQCGAWQMGILRVAPHLISSLC